MSGDYADLAAVVVDDRGVAWQPRAEWCFAHRQRETRWFSIAGEEQHARPVGPDILADLAASRTAEGKRLSWAIFAVRDHDAYARPFVLMRDTDVSGVSGTGVVADGCAFPDGTVALRWRGGNPTSVVFHDNGVESVEAIHGHGGATRLVWLAEDLETTTEVAAVYDERDALAAKVEALTAEVAAAGQVIMPKPATCARCGHGAPWHEDDAGCLPPLDYCSCPGYAIASSQRADGTP